MQLRLNPKRSNNPLNRSILLKCILVILVLFAAIFIIDKIDMQLPNKFIKQELSNDKIITVK
jgi:hypothetical protein|tara:strand:+ start:1335 stop:1520 length:186 start_codon:yes stop_codon:yes gene_type:complete